MLSSTTPPSSTPLSPLDLNRLPPSAAISSETEAEGLLSDHNQRAVSRTEVESIETSKSRSRSSTGAGTGIEQGTEIGTVVKVELAIATPDSASNVDTEGTTAENEQNPDANLVATPTATQTTTAVPEPLQDDQSTIYTVIEPASPAPKGSGPSSPTTQMTDQSWPEQPRQFLERIKETLSKAELANLLSKGCDPFHMAVLRIHMDSFDFRRDPIDLALRKFLLDFHFPKEAQQIDRVLEAFASRYHVCNPQLFRSGDVVYTIAFSLMLLHTDAHNRNVRHKMTKEQYVRQAKTIDGVNTIPADILEVLYDNITFLKFVYAEDELDVDGQRIAEVQPPTAAPWFSRRRNASTQRSDSYTMIRHGSITHLAPDLSDLIPFRWPYYWKGTIEMVDNVQINNQFTRAPQISIPGLRPRLHGSSSASLKSPTRSEAGFHLDGDHKERELKRDHSAQWAVKELEEGDDSCAQLKVVKSGILVRKIDIEHGKKSSVRGWRELGVILSGSQLLFFTDTAWFQQQRATQIGFNPQAPPEMDGFFATDLNGGTPPMPQALISTLDSIAVVDSSYQKYPHVFRLVCPNGKQYLLRAESEYEMNDWMAKINYASAFKTAGVRLRNYRVGWAPDVYWIKDDLGRYQLRRRPQPDGVVVNPEPADGRTQLIQAKMKDIDQQITTCSASLAAELRLARNLEVLIPLQHSTRQKIVQSATVVGKRLRLLMLERTKLDCFRTILERDLSVVGIAGHTVESHGRFMSEVQLSDGLSGITDYHVCSPSDFKGASSIHGRAHSVSLSKHEHEDWEITEDPGKDEHTLNSARTTQSSGRSNINHGGNGKPSRRLNIPEFDRSVSQDSLAEHCRRCPIKDAEIPEGPLAIQAAIIDAARGTHGTHGVYNKSSLSSPDLNQYQGSGFTTLDPSPQGTNAPPSPLSTHQPMLMPETTDAARSRPRTLSTPGQRPSMMPRTVSIYSSSSQTATKLRRILEQGLRHFKLNSSSSSLSSSPLTSSTSPSIPGSSLKTSFSANAEEDVDASAETKE
ncbi:hypothetical protein BGX34_011018 [Mortierella sp. NVP85]|nr:hypothetical protein BGX34_011018 [Mortierella sp. NVP85]